MGSYSLCSITFLYLNQQNRFAPQFPREFSRNLHRIYIFCFRGHTSVDNFIYELQKSTTIAFSRNSLHTFYSRNPTSGIRQCLRISNRKYVPPPPPCPQNFIIVNPPPPPPPLPFGNPKSRPWYGMDIFWNHPIANDYAKIQEPVL